MTEELIRSITAAEVEAAEIKRNATERAAAILSQAEENAESIRDASIKECKAYKDAQIKSAVSEADAAFQNALMQKKKDADEYCKNALESANPVVNTIIGRIIGGDC